MSTPTKHKKPYVKKDDNTTIMKWIGLLIAIALVVSSLVSASRSANETKRRKEDIEARRAFQAQFTDEQWSVLSSLNLEDMTEEEIINVITALKQTPVEEPHHPSIYESYE